MILGIDTSNYTTSVAIVTKEEQLCLDHRQLLEVAMGERGLQQSAAVFQHLKNLPDLLEQALKKLRTEVKGVCYSASPRPLAGSYMPVFQVGAGYARTLAAGLNVPLFQTSHQENHLAAGLWSAGFVPDEPFLTMHISGGTTDLLLVQPHSTGYQIELLGSSSDLHAGQFVDRVGVLMGLAFPSGPALEELALQVNEAQGVVSLPSAVQGYEISFSGPCSAAERELEAGSEKSEVAYALFRCIANSLEKVLLQAIQDNGIKKILFVGGVAANQLIRQRLKKRLAHRAVGATLYFAEPKYSRDNGIGTALLGLKKFVQGEEM